MVDDLQSGASAFWNSQPSNFQRVVIALLEHMGYVGAATTVAAGASGGLHGVVDDDALGERAYVEAIQSFSPVDEPAAASFIARIDRYHLRSGIFIATTTFSPHARSLSDQSSHQIALVDGLRLVTLVRDLDLKPLKLDA